MKIIALLFAILIVSSMGGIVNRKKSFGRTSTPEEINFQLLFLGTCNDFNSIPKVTVSSLSTGGCLPINPTSPFAATDDLTADVLCTNIGRNRAQIDFVEIYNGTEATPYTGGFAISFVPNKPFKANGQVSYLRRPSCTTQKDFCSTTTYVHSCTENPAVTKNGFVISNDEIFIVSNHLSAVGCGQAINSCCGYLSALCPRTAPNTLLKFNWDEHKYNSYNDHQEHHENNHHDDDDYKHGHGNQQGHGNQGHGNQGHGNQGHGNQHPPQHGNQHPPQNSYAQNNNQHKSEEDNNTHKIVFDDEEDDKKKK